LLPDELPEDPAASVPASPPSEPSPAADATAVNSARSPNTGSHVTVVPSTRPFVSSIIPGASTPAQLEENLAAAEYRLTKEDLAEIDRLTGG